MLLLLPFPEATAALQEALGQGAWNHERQWNDMKYMFLIKNGISLTDAGNNK